MTQPMSPADRLDTAEALADQVIPGLDPEPAAVAHSLIAIGRLLQNIDNRQAQQAGS